MQNSLKILTKKINQDMYKKEAHNLGLFQKLMIDLTLEKNQSLITSLIEERIKN